MKILLSYNFNKNVTPLGLQCERALISLGHDVHRMEVENVAFSQKLATKLRQTFNMPQKPKLKEHVQLDMDERLLKCADRVRPEVLFVIIGHDYSPEVLDTVKKRTGAKIIGWHFENPVGYRSHVDTLSKYDALFSFSEKFAKDITSLGITPCHYINYGTDCGMYRPMRLSFLDRIRLETGISFLGKFKERRRDHLNLLTGQDMGIWGPLWKKMLKKEQNPLLQHVKGYRLFNEKAAMLFNCTKVNLNINSWVESTGPNLRVFDVPACGSFLLTEYVEELEGLFKLGDEIETFKSAEEMSDKAVFYLKNDNVREKIAQRGYEKVTSKYSMKESIKKIFRKAF